MKIKDGFRLRSVMGEPTVIGEGVAQVDFNKLVTLNSSAAFLWESVEGKEFDVRTLASLLVEKYDIDENMAMNDAKRLCDQWLENGLAE